jgi:hypothetical protein
MTMLCLALVMHKMVQALSMVMAAKVQIDDFPDITETTPYI